MMGSGMREAVVVAVEMSRFRNHLGGFITPVRVIKVRNHTSYF